MPRQSRGPSRSAPSRPTAASRPAPPPPQQQQSRQASSVAHPPNQAGAQQPPTAQQGRSPGLFGQMASTAAGVAVGSSIGHAIGGFFGGGSSQAAEAPAQDQYAAQQYDNNNAYANTQTANNAGSQVCAQDVNNFRQCMDQNQGSLTICGWYLDQLKMCQQAASQY